jgi:DNA-binding NarL/FixJ family response regulator
MKLKVLIADDHGVVRKGLRLLLQRRMAGRWFGKRINYGRT